MHIVKRVAALAALAAAGFGLAAQAAGGAASGGTAPSAAPRAARTEDTAAIERIMDVTGTSRQLDGMSGFILALYDRDRKALQGEVAEAIDGVFRKQYAEAAFRQEVAEAMARSYDGTLGSRILTTYESPLFLRITEAELAHDGIEAEDEAASLDYSKVSPARDAVFEAFLEDSRVLEMSETVVAEMLRAYFTTFNLGLPRDSRIPASVIDAVTAQAREAMGAPAAIRKQKSRMAVTYEGFGDEELSAYFAFYATEEGRWLTRTFIEGVTEAFSKSMANSAREIQIVLGKLGTES